MAALTGSAFVDWSLPPLQSYPERVDRTESWLDRAERVATAWPKAAGAQLSRLRMWRLLARINAAEADLAGLQDAVLRRQIGALRDQLRQQGLRDPLVVRGFALIRELASRRLGLRHHDVQVIGGLALLNEMVAEMATGEGKTLTATLAVGVAALSGIPVHVITVNDYLAERDAQDLGGLYEALGLTVGTVKHGMNAAERRAAYACDITYASNKEIAFDYLRDRIILGNQPQNLKMKLWRMQRDERMTDRVVMRGVHFAIVDEADSVLVDEARTPLIISRETSELDERRWAEDALKLADALEAGRDYRLLLEDRRVELTSAGRERLAELGSALGGIWDNRIRREEAARQALAARLLFRNGEHYLVRDGKVQIVDEYTGRIMADRSWSDGLHQLVEAKEGCEVTSRKPPIARITYQRFFRRYRRLAGMTATAREIRRELWSVYGLRVLGVPPNQPLRRRTLPPRVYATEAEKWRSIATRSGELSRTGRPVLIGTRSVLASQIVSARLAAAGLDHVVLNAEQDRHEAEIIARAGEPGRITVATNMAGRGVDIKLPGEVIMRGGLHVILSERHDAKRIDRQLMGRAGRHGEPGTVDTILSLEDPLLELVPIRAAHRFARCPGPFRRARGLLLLAAAQRRAERSHAKARRDLLSQDRRLGTLLAFSGGME